MVAAGIAVGLIPIVPRTGAGAAPAANPPAIFAATAEAWAYSAELGVPGPLGPLASHTTAAVDNSPHAQGAAGLADPGYLVRAAAGLVAGIPTPAYCESAWPEGPDHADCGAPGGAPTAVSATRSGDGPRATSAAALADAAVPAGNGAASRQSRHDVAAQPPAPTLAADAAVVTIAAQSTTSSAFLADDGVLHAAADVVLSGVALAGGALRIGTLALHRSATATGLPGGTRTTAAIELSGVSVGGNPVDLGSDPVRSLAQAVQQAFGDTIAVEGLNGREEQSNEGKLTADSSGLQITWQPRPDRSLRIVLGYGRILVYATNPPSAEADVLPGRSSIVPDSVPSPPTGVLPQEGGASRDVAMLPNTTGRSAPETPVTEAPGPESSSEGAPTSGEAAAGLSEPVALVPGGRPLALGARPPVQWVSPFLVLAQMTTGRQAWWFLLGLAPLIAAAWLARRSGLGLVAPWAAGGRRGAPS